MHNEHLGGTRPGDNDPIFPTPVVDMEYIRQCQYEQCKQAMKEHALAFFKASEDWDASQTPEQFYDEWIAKI